MCVFVCIDVDECAAVDGAKLCSSETEKCVNTLGSYRCDCAEGFHRRSGKCEAKKCKRSKLFISLTKVSFNMNTFLD